MGFDMFWGTEPEWRDKMKKYGNIQPSFDVNRIELAKALPLATPFTVILDAGEVCNFKCNYCFRSEEDKKAWGYAIENNFMSKEIFELAVSQILLFPDAVRQISLSHQGEPLANRNLPWMVRYLKEKGVKGRVSIHTNGSLLTPEYAEDLADSEIDRIIVSLQGLSEEKYRSVCGYPIDFEKFYSNLAYFYKIKKNTLLCIKIIDSALGEGEEENFYDMFSPIADRVYVEKVTPIWKEKDYSNLGIEKREDLAFNKYGTGFQPQKVCPLIFHTIVVIPNGDVYPCTQLLQEEKLGNIREKTLLEMWNGAQRRDMLVQQCKFCAPKLCEDCGIRQNTIYAKEDMLDDYREEILSRLDRV